jgi:hypothetical protein
MPAPTIAERIKAKQQEILTARGRSIPPPPRDTQNQSPQPAAPPQKHPTPKQTANPTVAKPSRSRRKKPAIATDSGTTAPPDDETAELWALFQLPNHSQAIRNRIGPKLGAMLEGLLDGASKPGVQGASDRATLFKMLGAAWAQPAGVRAMDQGKASAIGDRLERAIARRRAAARQFDVTPDGDVMPEGAEVLAFPRTAQMIEEQVRYPDPAEEAGGEGESGLLGGW